MHRRKLSQPEGAMLQYNDAGGPYIVRCAVNTVACSGTQRFECDRLFGRGGWQHVAGGLNSFYLPGHYFIGQAFVTPCHQSLSGCPAR